jgi:hypothetical protein
MQSLVYKTPVETQHDLVAWIAVAAGTIREMPGIFQTVQHNIARWCRTCKWSWQPLFWATCKTTRTSPKTYASYRKLLWPLVSKGCVSRHWYIKKIWSYWTHLSTTERCTIHLFTSCICVQYKYLFCSIPTIGNTDSHTFYCFCNMFQLIKP